MSPPTPRTSRPAASGNAAPGQVVDGVWTQDELEMLRGEAARCRACRVEVDCDMDYPPSAHTDACQGWRTVAHLWVEPDLRRGLELGL